MADAPQPDQSPSESRTFIAVLAGTMLLAVIAVALSFILKTPLHAQFALSFNDFFIGVIATLPLAVFLWWFSNTTLKNLAAFRNSQIKFFAEIGFTITPMRIALMAIAAGVAEELLFRGVLQTWLAGFFPVAVAIIASNLLFGVLHMRTVLYAFIAGLVGVYLGVIFTLTENLITPMVTHALYDAVALEYTRRAVQSWRTHRI
ncbi:CPBP family intramembrane glutamic endopeptidase [Hyphococcus sp.]|uniref:CPBP family intramembrane glutamic endopeptidase n=1 Tax=Hyphococcus sp. TaxID=2038636 RepID=UPI003CCC17AE